MHRDLRLEELERILETIKDVEDDRYEYINEDGDDYVGYWKNVIRRLANELKVTWKTHEFLESSNRKLVHSNLELTKEYSKLGKDREHLLEEIRRLGNEYIRLHRVISEHDDSDNELFENIKQLQKERATSRYVLEATKSEADQLNKENEILRQTVSKQQHEIDRLIRDNKGLAEDNEEYAEAYREHERTISYLNEEKDRFANEITMLNQENERLTHAANANLVNQQDHELTELQNEVTRLQNASEVQTIRRQYVADRLEDFVEILRLEWTGDDISTTLGDTSQHNEKEG